jgi:hypothetical protein
MNKKATCQEIKGKLFEEAVSRHLDLGSSENAFLVGKLTPQAAVVKGFRDFEAASSYASTLKKAGNNDIYVLGTKPQYELLKFLGTIGCTSRREGSST